MMVPKASAKETVSISTGEVMLARAKNGSIMSATERLAKPAKTQAGQGDAQLRCRQIGV